MTHRLPAHTTQFFEKFIPLRSGYTSRKEQKALAQQIATDIHQSSGHTSLLNADTGVGKTLGYLVPTLLAAAQTGRRVIIATHTIHLLRQLQERDLGLVLDYVRSLTSIHLSYTMLLGRGNFVSAYRLGNWVREHRSTLNGDDKAILDELLDWFKDPACSGILADFIENCSDLPSKMRAEDICLTGSPEDESESEHYETNREQAASADIILTSHAMLISDSLYKCGVIPKNQNHQRDMLVIDEADNILEEYQSLSQQRLNLRLVRSRVEASASSYLLEELNDLIAEMQEEGARYGYPSFQAFGALAANEKFARLRRLVKTGRNTCHSIHELHEELEQTFSSLYGGRTGVGFSPTRKDPAIVRVSPWLSRKLGAYLAETYHFSLLTSATLSMTNDSEGFLWFTRSLGIQPEQIASQSVFSPSHYGDMTIHLVDKSWPRPFKKNAHFDDDGYDNEQGLQINPVWLDKTAGLIDDLAHAREGQNGNILVLTNSFAENKAIARRLKAPTVVEHKAGFKLIDCIANFKQTGGILITPSGASGMDIRSAEGKQFLDHLVITRLPFSPVNRDHQRAHIAYVTSQHKQSEAQARGALFQSAIGRATRLLRQKIGRGIRAPDDRINLWICDPRFPKWDERNSFHYFSHAIPERFAQAYMHFQPVSGAVDKTEARPLEMQVW